MLIRENPIEMDENGGYARFRRPPNGYIAIVNSDVELPEGSRGYMKLSVLRVKSHGSSNIFFPSEEQMSVMFKIETSTYFHVSWISRMVQKSGWQTSNRD